jgi:hypothetical protein
LRHNLEKRLPARVMFNGDASMFGKTRKPTRQDATRQAPNRVPWHLNPLGARWTPFHLAYSIADAPGISYSTVFIQLQESVSMTSFHLR